MKLSHIPVLLCQEKENFTYRNHGQISSLATSLRLEPVRPDTGINSRSVLGLKPHFLRYGTSFSLHSLYLKLKTSMLFFKTSS